MGVHVDTAFQGVDDDRGARLRDRSAVRRTVEFDRLPLRPAPAWIGPVHRITGEPHVARVAAGGVLAVCRRSGSTLTPRAGAGGSGIPCSGAPSTGRSPRRCSSCDRGACRDGRCPVVGGLLFTVLVLIWLTSSWWFFPHDRRRPLMLRRISFVVEGIVAVAVAVTVVLLFANQPEQPPQHRRLPSWLPAASTGRRCSATTPRCATAAMDPAGSARASPAAESSLSIRILPTRSPSSPTASAGMPAFGDRLSAEEIAAVVEYTRTVLAEG